MKSRNIAIISYEYPIETSPFIVNLCSYLAEKGNSVDIILARFLRDRFFSLPGIRIIRLLSFWKFNVVWKYFVHRLNKLMAFDSRLFACRLMKKIFNYDLAICMEFWSLDAIAKTGFPLSRCIYCSFEGLACTKPFELEYVKRLISSCAFSIIACEERGKDIDKHLGINVDWEYVPVSLRPPVDIGHLNKILNKQINERIRIVQSGYFAEWTCLYEFLSAYQGILRNNTDVYLHGHNTGTKKYYRKILSKIENMKDITVDLSYYDEEKHLDILSKFDIGLAFYKNYISSADWENLLFSSGKIATYLWAGLAVLTNIDHPHTQHPPFLYVNEINPACILKALEKFKYNKELFRNAAIEHAQKYYNLDLYMNKIGQRINSTLQ